MRRILTLALMITAVSAYGSDFSIRILSYPKKVPEHVPVRIVVEMKNTSNHPIVVAKGKGGFALTVDVHRSDGLARKRCPPPADYQYSLGFTQATLPAEWSEIRIVDLPCQDDPGEWVVQAVLSSHGPYPRYREGEIIEQMQGWQGEIKSEEVPIEITEPMGLDRDAFEAFHGQPLLHPQELLRQYPTSAYTAWELWLQGLTWYDSEGTMPEIGAEKDFNAYKIQKEVYCDSPGSFRSWLGQVNSITDPWEKLYRDFPDFSYRPELLYGLARCYMHLGEQQKAVPLLQELLSKFPDSEPGKKAVAYKDVLKARGLWPE
jgi:hypothetical protein